MLFQIVVRFALAGLIMWFFLQAIFWFRKQKAVKASKPCCKGTCKTDAVAPTGVSENKKEGTTDA